MPAIRSWVIMPSGTPMERTCLYEPTIPVASGTIIAALALDMPSVVVPAKSIG